MVSNIILSAAAWASSLRNSLVERLEDEGGQDLIEYAVLVGGIAIVALAALAVVPLAGGGGAFEAFGNKIAACVSFGTVGPSACP